MTPQILLELLYMMMNLSCWMYKKNTSAVRDKYRNDLVFVLYSVFNDYFQASLVQYRY